MGLLENLRPMPDAATNMGPSRDAEFAAAVRAGIPEVLHGGQTRTDLSRRVVEIEDTQPRKLVKALVTESRQAYVDKSPPITTVQVLRGILSCSEILAHMTNSMDELEQLISLIDLQLICNSSN